MIHPEYCRMIDRLVEYASGATLFGSSDTELFAKLYSYYKQQGDTAEIATKKANLQVVERIVQETAPELDSD